jgi:TP901 family phage tail tape measure protein
MPDVAGGAVTNLETLVVKLMADAGQYQATLARAEADATATVNAIEADVARLGAVATRAINAAITPLQAYTNHVRDLDAAYRAGLMGTYEYVRAMDRENIALREAGVAQQAMDAELRRTVTTVPAAAAVIRSYERAVQTLNEQLRQGLISYDAYRARVATLAEQALPRVRAATREYEAATAAAARRTAAYNAELEANNRILQGQVNVAQRARNAIMQQGIAVTDQVMTATQRYEARLMELNGLLAAGAITQNTYNAAVRAAGYAAAQAGQRLMGMQIVISALGTGLQRAGYLLSAGITAPVVALAAVGVREFAHFDDAMNRTFAVMGDVSAGMRKEMRDTATTISNNSITSAVDLAKAYYTLAQAGLDAGQAQTALNIVNKFAVAGNIDLQHAAERLIDVQRTMGMESKVPEENAKSLQRVADVIMKASIETQASAEDFAKSLSTKVGAKARQLGKDIEEVTAALMAYASQGTKAQLAGEQGYIVLRDLTTAANKNEAAWKRLGMAVYDENEQVRDMADIIQDLTLLMSGLSDKQKVQTMQMLGFKDRSSAATNTLIGLGEAMKEYEVILKSAGGEIDRVAGLIEGSFLSQLRETWNQVKNVAREIGEILAPYLEKLNDYLREGIKWWHGLSQGTKETLVWIAGLAAVVGPLLVMLGGAVLAVAGVVGAFAGLVALGPEVLAFVAGIAATAATWAAWGVAIAAAVGVALKALYDPEGFVSFAEQVARWIGKAWLLQERLFSAFTGWLVGVGVPMLIGIMVKAIVSLSTIAVEMTEKLAGFLWEVVKGVFTGDVSGAINKFFLQLQADFNAGASDPNLFKTFGNIIQEETGIAFNRAGANAGREYEAGLAGYWKAHPPAMDLFKSIGIKLPGMDEAAMDAQIAAIDKGIGEAEAKLKKLGEDFEKRDMSATLKEFSKEGIAAKKELDDLIEKEKEMQATVGMSRAEVLAWKLEMHGASEEIVAQAQAFAQNQLALKEAKKEMEDWIKAEDDAQRRADALIEKHRDPVGKLREDALELRDLFKEGRIAQNIYDKEMKDIEDKIKKIEGKHAVTFEFKSVEAATAGSADALNRVAAFLASGAAAAGEDIRRVVPFAVRSHERGRAKALEKKDVKLLEKTEAKAAPLDDTSAELKTSLDTLAGAIVLNTEALESTPRVELEAAGL